MTYSTDPLERFVTTARTDLKTWPQLLPFRQPMPAGRLSRDVVVAFFVSVVIHAAFLTLLLWGLANGRRAVESTIPSIGTPLIVSLYTPATTSHYGPDRKAVSEMPHTGPSTQRSQSSPERSRSAEHKSEAETVVTSKGQKTQGSETPEGKSLATGATPSFDMEAAYRRAWDFGRLPDFKAETIVTSKGQGTQGSEAPKGKSLATDTIPSFNLKAAYRIARNGSWMSEGEVWDQTFKWRTRYIKNYEASLPPT